MTRIAAFVREIPGVLVPVLWMMLLVTIALALLNRVPTSIQNWMAGAAADTTPVFKRYASIEEVERKLDVRLELPSYFPDYLDWPPAAVDASQKPVPIISIFATAVGAGDGLILEQIILKDKIEVPSSVKFPATVKEKLSVAIGRNRGLLVIGQKNDGTSQNQVRWQTEEREFVLEGPFSESELLRIANSVR